MVMVNVKTGETSVVLLVKILSVQLKLQSRNLFILPIAVMNTNVLKTNAKIMIVNLSTQTITQLLLATLVINHLRNLISLNVVLNTNVFVMPTNVLS
jgi:hypothetical protein